MFVLTQRRRVAGTARCRPRKRRFRSMRTRSAVRESWARVPRCTLVRYYVCRVLQCVAVCCSVLQCELSMRALLHPYPVLCIWQCVAVWCRVLQSVAEWQSVAVCCSVLQCGLGKSVSLHPSPVLCVLQSVAKCCSVMRCNAACRMCCSEMQFFLLVPQHVQHVKFLK